MRKNKRSPAVLAKKSSIVATEVALALMAAQLAYAQTPPERVERVEITGTRLPALSTEGPSPVAVMNSEEIRMDGLAKTEDLLNNLPQVYGAQTAGVANGATGTANVNLRNLGSNRNLVLMNGRRLPPGSPGSGSETYAADLNQIPAPLIQRVELLTGGASAVYGSDAISGVVNFIMNDKFEGVQLDLGHSFYNHQQHNGKVSSVVAAREATNPSQFRVPGDVDADGRINSISLLMGKNFADNKGNATVFLNYKKESAVLQRDRDFSACALNPGTVFTCGGSSTNATGRFIGGLGATDPGFDLTVADTAGNVRPFAAATDQFNFGPYNYYRRPSEQYGANAFAHLDIHPNVRAYTELGFHDNHTNAVIAPGGVFLGETVHTIFFENPLLTPAWRSAIAAGQTAPFAAPGDTADMLIGRRNVEGGGRDTDLRHTSYRMLFGAKGEVLKNWNYDAFWHMGKVHLQQNSKNFFSNRRIGRAIDVVTDPATGLPACRSFVDGTDLNCVPYDLRRLGGVTPAALNYLQVPGLQWGNTHQDVIGATASADLGSYGMKLPTAKSGIGVVFGIERRREKLQLEADTSSCEPDLSGSGGATCPVKGALGVKEYFTEVRVPLIEGRPLADLLSVSGSYRHSDYTSNKKTNTYGVGAEWAPVRNYRLRGSYQRAVRHANITELYQPQNGNLFGMNQDPCGPDTASGTGPTATAAQCALTGLAPAQYGSALLFSPAGQYQFLEGGNPNLDPEKADSWTLGLEFTPTRNLTGTIDWWRIKIDDAIDVAPPDVILTQCLETGTLCNQVQRDPVTGALWLGTGQIVSTNANLGGYQTSGIDFAVNYVQKIGAMGSFGLHFLGTWVSEWEFEPIKNGGRFDCVGLYGSACGTPNPEWRHKVRVSWTTPWNLDLALTWRHIAKVDIEGTSSHELLNDPGVAETDKTLGQRDYLDFAAQMAIGKSLVLRAGVNNIFDRDPPIVSSIIADPAIFGNGNTFPTVYDTLGRLIFINLTIKL